MGGWFICNKHFNPSNEISLFCGVLCVILRVQQCLGSMYTYAYDLRLNLCEYSDSTDFVINFRWKRKRNWVIDEIHVFRLCLLRLCSWLVDWPGGPLEGLYARLLLRFPVTLSLGAPPVCREYIILYYYVLRIMTELFHRARTCGNVAYGTTALLGPRWSGNVALGPLNRHHCLRLGPRRRLSVSCVRYEGDWRRVRVPWSQQHAVPCLT